MHSKCHRMKTALLLVWRGTQLLSDVRRPGSKKFKQGAALHFKLQGKVSVVGHTVSDSGFLFRALDLTAI